MTTLAADAPRAFFESDFADHPVIASDIIYGGAAVGENGSGYARPLSGGDRFLGFADYKADNSTGSAGDVDVRCRKRGTIDLSVTGAVITDVGQPVYATDDNTFTFVPTSATFVGFVKRFISSGRVSVEFDVAGFRDPYGDSPRETISANKTIDALDSGKVFFIDTDATTTTLPATATAGFITLVNIGADGTVAVNASPAAADKITGPDVAGTDNKDLINTKATARRGDRVTLKPGHADGWVVHDIKGIWAEEA